jgi:hypothetical protein
LSVEPGKEHLAAEDVSELIREQVLERDGHQCQVCGRTSNLELHHWVYRSQGGGHGADNLVTVCHWDHHLIHTGRIDIEMQCIRGTWHAFVRR